MGCPNVKECACPKKACPNNGRCCACVPNNNGDKSNRNHYEVLKKRFEG